MIDLENIKVPHEMLLWDYDRFCVYVSPFKPVLIDKPKTLEDDQNQIYLKLSLF